MTGPRITTSSVKSRPSSPVKPGVGRPPANVTTPRSASTVGSTAQKRNTEPPVCADTTSIFDGSYRSIPCDALTASPVTLSVMRMGTVSPTQTVGENGIAESVACVLIGWDGSSERDVGSYPAVGCLDDPRRVTRRRYLRR